MSTMDMDHNDSSVEPESLPPKFESISDILQISNERLKANTFTNVMGIVTDFQPPIRTRGSDWLCTFTMKDISTQYDKGIKCYIFWPPQNMPIFERPNDVVLIRNAKIQMYMGFISLQANHSTEFHHFHGHRLSWPIKSPQDYPESRCSKKGGIPASGEMRGRSPSPTEKHYAVWMHHHIEKEMLPSAEEFETNKRNAMKVQDKFSLLKDVKEDKFYNIIAEIVRMHDSGGKLSLYVTDYTPNSHFYKHTALDVDEGISRDGDEYGYTKSRPKTDSTWPGPFGKMTIQLTLWDGSANYLHENGKPKDWVLFENIRMKFPANGGCLEGIQHSEQDNRERVRVAIMTQSEDPDANDTRWKDAIRRKRAYWKKYLDQKKALEVEIDEHREKRPPSDDPAISARKKRRKDKKEHGDSLIQPGPQKLPSHQENLQPMPQLQKTIMSNLPVGSIKEFLKDKLNDRVRANHPEVVPFSFNELFNLAVYMRRTDKGNLGALPFINRNLKVAVKVVDFFPHSIADFAQGRVVSEYDMLSDDSGGEESDQSEEIQPFKLGSSSGQQRKWEWRFSLLLEDQCPHRPEKLLQWVVVDNHSAQMLLSMDATDLRRDKEALSELRKRLSVLWGNLEQLKWKIFEDLKKLPGEHFPRDSKNKVPVYETALVQQLVGEPSDPEASRVTQFLEKDGRLPKALMNEVAKQSRSRPSIYDMPPTSDDEGEVVADRQKKLPVSSGEAPISTANESTAGENPLEMKIRDPNNKVIFNHLADKENILKSYFSDGFSRVWSKTLLESNDLQNMPFACCLMEYGVKWKSDPDDYFNFNYQRRLKLFGTTISEEDP